MKLILFFLRLSIALMIFVAISVILSKVDTSSTTWWLNTTWILYVIYEIIKFHFDNKK